VPNYTDREGHIATTTAVISSPVSFMSWNNSINGFDIYPKKQLDVGEYMISLNLSDGGGASTLYTVWIKVNNSAPIWDSRVYNYSIPAMVKDNIPLPIIVD
jgi:hypothetical protein